MRPLKKSMYCSNGIKLLRDITLIIAPDLGADVLGDELWQLGLAEVDKAWASALAAKSRK